MKEGHLFEPMQGSLGNKLAPCKTCGYARASIVHTNRDTSYADAVEARMSGTEVSQLGGQKHDAEKPRYDLVPPQALEWIAQVLTYGAHKYAPENWRKVDGWRWRYFSAAMRHLWAWQKGERYDQESTLPHLAHALCCLMFMLELDVQELPPEARKP